jgi:very-short-patch-repair endonuclease
VWDLKKPCPFIPYNPKLKELARNLRKNSTLGEVLLWKRIRNKQVMGYKFLRQRPVGNYIVDFYCQELLLAIEIDGGSHDRKLLSAEARQEWLESRGISVIRFMESDVRSNMEGVLQRLCGCIEEREKTHPPNPPQGGNS